MANNKIPKGYQGTYMKASNGEPTLVMVSRHVEIDTKKQKGGTKLAENKVFTKWTTDEKKKFGKQFTAKERASYRKGQENAYRHAANMSGKQAKFLADNRSGSNKGS